MSNKYCYKIMITTIYLDDTSNEYYLNGVYIDLDKAINKANKTMLDILEETGFNYIEIRKGHKEYGMENEYWTYVDLENHPKIESIWVEVEESGEILD